MVDNIIGYNKKCVLFVNIIGVELDDSPGDGKESSHHLLPLANPFAGEGRGADTEESSLALAGNGFACNANHQ